MQTLTRTRTHRFSCHGGRMLFACFCHTDDVCVCVSCWRASWPKLPAAFLEGDTSITHQQHGQAASKTCTDLDTLWHPFCHSSAYYHCCYITTSSFLKDLDICLYLNGISLAGVTGEMFMKHAEGPGNCQPIGPCFMLVATTHSRRKIKCTVMW